MSYILFDLEFNQFEIIQIGAIKLDADFNTLDTFDRYVKPTFHKEINPFVTALTGITTNQLLLEEPFPEVYKAYTKFIGDRDSVFCIWGMSDIKVLFRNVEHHQLSSTLLPKRFINIQPYASMHFNLPPKKLLRLQDVVSNLYIPITYPFHNALYDAYYTAEIFKKLYHPSIQPSYYDPSYIRPRSTVRKKQIDIEGLLKQFEKMYDRQMTKEEQAMIKLAYKMGKTNQFLK